jgi:DNA-binding MarR family transcriptional regulator
VRHVIDYMGAVLVALAATSFVLLTSLGGTTYPWGSAEIVILGAAGVILTVAFVAVERRAAEPVIPLHLFANRVFAAASAIGFVVGFAMFGAITFLPLFLQIVKGVNPTVSGLRLLPLLGGLIVTSAGSGQLISRYGRYKVFPIVGTALMTVGLFLLSRLGPTTSTALTSVYMFVFGVGLGGVMQVLVIAVQNAVDYKDLGAATSGATFFRSMGGSFGTAIFGAIFANLLTGNLSHYLKGVTVPAGLSGSSVSPESLAKLPPQVHAGYVQAYAHSLQTVFLVAVPVAGLAFLLTWALPELQLRKTTEATHTGDVFALPTDRSSLKEMERAVTVLARKENRPELFRRIAARAHVDLEPVLCWLLLCIDRHPERSVGELACPPAMSPERAQELVQRLATQGLVVMQRDGSAADGAPPVLTPAGRDTVAKLIEARRQGLANLLEGWSPEEHDELVALLRRLGREMLDDRRPPQREQALAGSAAGG